MNYDLVNLISTFQFDLETILMLIDNGQQEKARHRIQSMIESLERLRERDVGKPCRKI